MMLYDVMRKCRNFFVVETHLGVWTIEGGAISLPFLAKGQYFLIDGSKFNDGVYKYDDELTLVDESFTGVVADIAIPPAFIQLCEEIAEWNEKNADAVNSPYQSESFGGYSYTKASGSSGAYTWEDAFKSRLREWRKI